MQGVSWFAGGGWLIKLIHCGLFWVVGLMVWYWVGGLLCKTRIRAHKTGYTGKQKVFAQYPLCVWGYGEPLLLAHPTPTGSTSRHITSISNFLFFSCFSYRFRLLGASYKRYSNTILISVTRYD